MSKQKILVIILAIILLGGLVATKQVNWTPGEEKGVPIEEYTQGGSQGGNQQQGETKQENNDQSQNAGQTDPNSQNNPHENPHEQMQGDIETNEAGFPKEITGLKLNTFLSGQEAIKSIEELHGTEIEIVDGFVAKYGGGDRKVEIWVSQAKSEQAASQQVDLMTEMIMKNSDMFAKPSAFQIKGIRFFQTQGMGMNNYYYKKGKKAYWISVKGVKEAPIMGLIFQVL
jgi:hypothetical protein